MRLDLLAGVAAQYPVFELSNDDYDYDYDCSYGGGYPPARQEFATEQHLDSYMDWDAFAEYADPVANMVEQVVCWCIEADIHLIAKAELAKRKQKRENERLANANEAIASLKIEASIGSPEWFEAIVQAIECASHDRIDDFSDERRMERWADSRFAGGDFWADEDYISDSHSARIGALEGALQIMQKVMPIQYGVYLESKRK